MKKICSIMLGVMMLFLSAAVFADVNKNILSPEKLTWKALPNHPEIQYAVLAGNPMQSGIFTVRMKFPKDYSDVVHSHELPRYDTIISGALYLGFGDKVDKSNTEKMPAGGFFTCPAGVKHFGFTHEETVVQITGMGPWEVLKSKGLNR